MGGKISGPIIRGLGLTPLMGSKMAIKLIAVRSVDLKAVAVSSVGMKAVRVKSVDAKSRLL